MRKWRRLQGHVGRVQQNSPQFTHLSHKSHLAAQITTIINQTITMNYTIDAFSIIKIVTCDGS